MKIVSQSTKKFVAKNFCSKRCENRQRSNDFRLPTTIFSTKVKPDIPFIKLKLLVKENLKKMKLSGSKILNRICFLLKRNKLTKEVTKIKEMHTIKQVFIETLQNSHMEEKKCCVVVSTKPRAHRTVRGARGHFSMPKISVLL
jgi:hypothetical protein